MDKIYKYISCVIIANCSNPCSKLFLLDYIERILKRYPVTGLTNKHQFDQLFKHWVFFYLYLEVFIFNLVHDTLLRKVLFRNPKWQLPCAKLVYGHSNTPNIATTDFFHLDSFQDLRSHILWCSSESDTLIRIDYLRS